MGLSAGTIEKLDARDLAGVPLKVTTQVPEGHFIIADYGGKAIWVGPLTVFRLTHDGLYPFETQYCRGLSELRRERRLHGRAQ